MTNENMRFGIIGPGAVARLHAIAIERAKGARLVAVCGRDQKKTSTFAAEYGIEAYTDLATFLSRHDLDGVTIATPSGTHLVIGEQAARAGKHVLCEKPLEVTSEKAGQLIQVCRENNVRLGVFFQARFDECTRLAKEAIVSGQLGRILLASCQMRWYRSQHYYDSAPWRGTWSLDGGGALMNQGIHTVDLLIHLAGSPVEVFSFQGPLTHQRIEVEDTLCAAIRFANGAIGTIEASTSSAPGFPRRLEISGDCGTIGIEDNRIVRWEFTKKRPEDKERVIRPGNIETKGGAADPMAIDVSGHCQVIEDFIQSIREHKQPAIDGNDGKKAVDCVCAIYDSMKTGKPVRLG